MSFRETEIGTIPIDWETKSLGDIADVLDPHPSHRAPKEVEKGFPFAGIGDIDQYGNIDIKKARVVLKEIIDSHESNYIIDQNSIGYGRVGTVGKVVKLRERSNCKYALSPTLAVINPNKLIDAKFLYALLRSDLFYNQVFKFMTGSTRPSIGIKVLRNITIPYPSFKEQSVIGQIIGVLDEKIEVNNQINKTLEDMAQAIFKQWFVDFEFPNENGEPYKSSGGEMVESELGMIPKGWEVSRLEDLCSITSSKRIFMNEYVPEGIPFYRGKEIIEKSKGSLISTELYISIDKYNEIKSKFSVPEKGDILLTSVGTLGVPYKVDDEQFYFKDGNLTWFKDFIENEYSNYIYLWLMSNEGRESLNSITIGSTQKALTIASLKGLRLIKSDELILKKFEAIISNLIDKIYYNNKEKSYLINLRNTLLPKLMSGEIRVPINK